MCFWVKDGDKDIVNVTSAETLHINIYSDYIESNAEFEIFFSWRQI